MNDTIVFPKIKKDIGGTPMEYILADVPAKELLRAPEDVSVKNELVKDYSSGSLKFKVVSTGHNFH